MKSLVMSEIDINERLQTKKTIINHNHNHVVVVSILEREGTSVNSLLVEKLDTRR